MIILANPDILQVITLGTTTVDTYVAYTDFDGTSTFVPGRQVAAIVAGAPTTTDILATPAGGHFRSVKTVNIRNKHASASTDVTVQLNVSATLTELHKATLSAGQCLQWIESDGWDLATVGSPVTTAALTADATTSTVTLPAEVTGLTIPMGVGTWTFRYTIVYQSAVTTTGIRVSVNHTGTVTRFTYNWGYVDTTATASTAAASQAEVGAAAAVYGVFSARAKTTAGTGTTISTDVANADMQLDIWGTAVVTVAGNIALWYGSEVAANCTIMAGSNLVLTKVA
jgi:hypothetical protein